MTELNDSEINGLMTKIQPSYIFQSSSKSPYESEQISEFSFKKELIYQNDQKENINMNIQDNKMNFKLPSRKQKFKIIDNNTNKIKGILFSGHFCPIEKPHIHQNINSKPFQSIREENFHSYIGIEKKGELPKTFSGLCKNISLTRSAKFKILKSSEDLELERIQREIKEIKELRKKNELSYIKFTTNRIFNINDTQKKKEIITSKTTEVLPFCFRTEKIFLNKKRNNSRCLACNPKKDDIEIEDLTNAFSTSLNICKDKKTKEHNRPRVSLYLRKKSNAKNNTSMISLNESMDVSKEKTPAMNKKKILRKQKGENVVISKKGKGKEKEKEKCELNKKPMTTTPIEKCNCKKKVSCGQKENIDNNNKLKK